MSFARYPFTSWETGSYLPFWMLLLGPRRGSCADKSGGVVLWLVLGWAWGPGCIWMSLWPPCDRPRSWPHERSRPSGPSHPASVLPPHSAAPGLTSAPQLTLWPVLVLPLLGADGHAHVLGHLRLPPRSFLGTPFFPCSSGASGHFPSAIHALSCPRYLWSVGSPSVCSLWVTPPSW